MTKTKYVILKFVKFWKYTYNWNSFISLDIFMLENIFEFIWWLWLFILWIFLFDEAIKKLTTNSFKTLIQKTTNTLFKSIWTGTVATIILQWSTAVVLIAVSFIAAWIINFNSAIWVILWANLGTPIVSIILWNLWLRVSFASIAMPIIWVFSLLLFLFSKNDKLKNIFKIVVWLALLFLWLWYVNDSMVFLSSYVDFDRLASYPVILFFVIWLLLTVVVQSSSIPIVLILTAANTWLVNYPIWIMFILWSFLWTTFTTILWALDWNYLKKQVAYSHVFFNLFATIFWFLTYRLYDWTLIKMWVDRVLWLSIFAVSFKFITVLLMLPFLKYFVLFITKLFPKKRTHLWLAIENASVNVVDASLLAIRKDQISLLKKIFKYILNIWSVDEKEVLKMNVATNDYTPTEVLYNKYRLEMQYSIIKEIEQKLVVFQTQLKNEQLSTQDQDELYLHIWALWKMVSAAKYMKDVSKGIMDMQYSQNKWISSKYYDYRQKLAWLYKDISLIIDWENGDDLLERIITLMETIKITDEDFVWEFTGNLWWKDIDQTTLSDALHVNRYFYLSCLELISSLGNLFLSDEHRKLLEKIA